MTDHAHGHDDHGGHDSHADHGHSKSHATASGSSNMDSIFTRLETWITDTISRFVFAVFVIFGLGAIYGTFIAPYLAARYGILPVWGWTIGPFIIGFIALENRDIATILFLLLIGLVVIL